MEISVDELSAAIICRDDALDVRRDSGRARRPGCNRNGIRHVPYRYENIVDRTRISAARYLRSHAGTQGH